MLYQLSAPQPWGAEASYIDVGTPTYEDDQLVDELYAGRTPKTVQDWRGFPLVDIEARLLAASRQIDVQDFVWGSFGDVVVSDRLLRILQEEQLSGIGTRSVTLEAVEIGTVDLMKDPSYTPPKLHRLVAKGIVEGAPKDVPPPDPDWPLILDLESWDGSDLCVAWGAWLLVFVSQRFVDCLRRHNVRNYRVVPGREFSFDGHRYIAFRTRD